MIGVSKGNAAPREAVHAAIADSGFKGRFANVETQTLPISGMTCEACAAQLQAELAKVPGVRSAEVIYKKHKPVVVADTPIDSEALTKVVEAAGYKVGSERKLVNGK